MDYYAEIWKMQGDLNVDLLMLPVLHAIERHVKDRDAITDIYNRAYEAVMNGMDVKTGKTYCAYCGAEYPLDDNAANQVSEHIKTCEKHPMRAVEARAEAAQTEISSLLAVIDKAVDCYFNDKGNIKDAMYALRGKVEPK